MRIRKQRLHSACLDIDWHMGFACLADSADSQGNQLRLKEAAEI
jgi:hypothetical protein